ncbi:hypothetical protein GYMLUDRAFT_557461 [Collybiopsis luxurians FD-317 M1]|uniref:Uncharacterized protein n=1 Tax=Collybiopsis luxurians FD-317 M1 TaxID=944289 RepID=A0A0D0BDP0_9AGAR|nr:hypothetical protein GYMLUDRAFT_557461 [Collybiopsis luxurians FD-317 M1]
MKSLMPMSQKIPNLIDVWSMSSLWHQVLIPCPRILQCYSSRATLLLSFLSFNSLINKLLISALFFCLYQNSLDSLCSVNLGSSRKFTS